MVRVKICGVTRESDVATVADAGADAVGVVASVPIETPREVSVHRACELLGAAPPYLTTTLVTMPKDVGEALSLLESVDPDVIQIHGHLAASDLERIRTEGGVQVVAAVGSDDFDRAREVDQVADAVLVDSATDSGAGGTGTTHDWSRTRQLVSELASPVVLAGGLTPENVREAAETVGPYAVDTASGVERTGGIKDHDAVRSFVRNGRAVEAVSP